MPLVSRNQVNRSFPPRFAARVDEHARRRTDAFRAPETQAETQEGRRYAAMDKNLIEERRTQAASQSGTQEKERVSHGLTNDARTLTNSQQHIEMEQREDMNDTPTTEVIEESTRGPVPMTTSDMTDLTVTSQAWWAVRPRSRGLHSRGSHRTTVSLETVDLWESDSEEGEMRTDSHDGYDRINGVLINPRKTFDFSDLRRSRSPVIKEEHVTKAETRRNGRENEQRWVNSERQRIDRRGDATESEKKLTVAQRLQNIRSKPTQRLGKCKINNNDMESTETLIVSEGKCDERPTNCELGNAEVSFKDAGIVGQKKGKPRVKRIPGIHEIFQIQKELTDRLAQIPSKDQPSITHHPPSPPPSRPATPTPPVGMVKERTHGKRRVKFNSIVSVRDGESNHSDVLRQSKNSAQLFKRRYLGGVANSSTPLVESERPSTPTPDSACYVQLAY